MNPYPSRSAKEQESSKPVLAISARINFGKRLPPHTRKLGVKSHAQPRMDLPGDTGCPPSVRIPSRCSPSMRRHASFDRKRVPSRRPCCSHTARRKAVVDRGILGRGSHALRIPTPSIRGTIPADGNDRLPRHRSDSDTGMHGPPGRQATGAVPQLLISRPDPGGQWSCAPSRVSRAGLSRRQP